MRSCIKSYFRAMKIALIGYGKMGHEVETAALARGHSVVAAFDVDNPLSEEALRSSGAEVAIDFTQPDSVVANALISTEAGVPLVIGTTGWDEQLPHVRAMVEAANTACVYASNFSIGVNLFLKIVAEAARLLNSADYDAYISEAHHNQKKDFPSGTALRIADAVLSGLKSKTRIESVLVQGEPPAKDTLLISSIRAGSITGTHTVGFQSAVDEIELTHRAKSRAGFALGAVRAAEWVRGKHGAFRFEEHIAEILGI